MTNMSKFLSRKISMNPLRLLLVAFTSLFILSACGTRQLTSMENGGQSFANVRVLSGMKPDLETLAIKDTIVIARQGIEEPVVVASNKIRFEMVEPVSYPIELGIPNFEGRFSPKAADKTIAKPEPKFNLRLVKHFEKVGEFTITDTWRTNSVAGLAKLGVSQEQVKTGVVPVRFRLMAFNTGDADFVGDFSFVDRLATNLEFASLDRSNYLNSRTGVKAVAGALTLGLSNVFLAHVEDYGADSSRPVVGQGGYDAQTRVLSYAIKDLVLKPGEGIDLLFHANVLLPRDEELLKIRMNPGN
jgi:hypothetical protein